MPLILTMILHKMAEPDRLGHGTLAASHVVHVHVHVHVQYIIVHVHACVVKGILVTINNFSKKEVSTAIWYSCCNS